MVSQLLSLTGGFECRDSNVIMPKLTFNTYNSREGLFEESMRICWSIKLLIQVTIETAMNEFKHKEPKTEPCL